MLATGYLPARVASTPASPNSPTPSVLTRCRQLVHSRRDRRLGIARRQAPRCVDIAAPTTSAPDLSRERSATRNPQRPLGRPCAVAGLGAPRGTSRACSARTLTTALALRNRPGTTSRPPWAGLPAPRANRAGPFRASPAGARTGTPGVTTSTMFSSAALRRRRVDAEHAVEVGALAGREARDQEAALAAAASQRAVGTHERHLARDMIADAEVAGGETAAVADADLVALHGRRPSPSRLLGVFFNGRVATWWAGAAEGIDRRVVERGNHHRRGWEPHRRWSGT